MNETLNSVRSRPRFKIKTKISPQEFSKNLKLRIKGYDNFEGSVNQETAIIYIKTKTTPYWKPQLSLRTELNTEENTTEITGVFRRVLRFGRSLCSFISFWELDLWYFLAFILSQNKLTPIAIIGHYMPR